MIAIKLETQIIAITSIIPDGEDTWLIAKALTARMVKTRNDASHALAMFLLWFLIELKFGLSKPKASLVFAVDPTTEPTLLTLLIK